MRIRKNAKISPVLYALSSLKEGVILEPHVCQLNQSPWDVMTFSPPSSPPRSQDNVSGASAENGSSGGCISATESEFNALLPSESLDDTMDEVEVEVEDSPPPMKKETVVMCCSKTDGKSWHCQREASQGHSLCDHHLSLVKSYSSNSGQKSAKAAGEGSVPARRTRLKKAASTSDPNDFYYYSGFGPRWGKNRGESSRNNNHGNVNEIAAQESDDVEYEDDDEEEEEEEMGKKRARKPIKARSLKSLM